jgi:hypothetical protein
MDYIRYRASEEHNWKWIGQPARLDYLARAEVLLHFKASDADRLLYATQAQADVNGSRWKAIAAA